MFESAFKKDEFFDFYDLLNELQRCYEVEKNVKNNLYSFILQNFMFNELKEYEKTHDMAAPGGHDECLKILAHAPEGLVKFSPRQKMLDYINRELKLSARLVKLILTSIETGKTIKEEDPELDNILKGYEALRVDYPSENLIDTLSDKEINRLIEEKGKRS